MGARHVALEVVASRSYYRSFDGRRFVAETSRQLDGFFPAFRGREIERIYRAAPGNEIQSGKFDHPESSAALAANAFGYFLGQAEALPRLPGCPEAGWPAQSLALEATVRFPWSGGRHPVLDCLITTSASLIGVESKRFEPFRTKRPAAFSDAYWRPC